MQPEKHAISFVQPEKHAIVHVQHGIHAIVYLQPEKITIVHHGSKQGKLVHIQMLCDELQPATGPETGAGIHNIHAVAELGPRVCSVHVIMSSMLPLP